jgi:hypothetical protein
MAGLGEAERGWARQGKAGRGYQKSKKERNKNSKNNIITV